MMSFHRSLSAKAHFWENCVCVCSSSSSLFFVLLFSLFSRVSDSCASTCSHFCWAETSGHLRQLSKDAALLHKAHWCRIKCEQQWKEVSVLYPRKRQSAPLRCPRERKAWHGTVFSCGQRPGRHFLSKWHTAVAWRNQSPHKMFCLVSRLCFVFDERRLEGLCAQNTPRPLWSSELVVRVDVVRRTN